MKNFQRVFLAVAIMCSSIIMANTDPSNSNSKAISTELSNLLNEHDLNVDLKETIQVTFMVNKDNEVVVLDVDTSNLQVESFIKNRLNYKKLATQAKKGQKYFLPVTLEATS